MAHPAAAPGPVPPPQALQLLADSPNEKVVLKMIRTLSCLSTANARVIQAFLARAGLQKIKAREHTAQRPAQICQPRGA